MTASVLERDYGPRARRRAHIASIVALVAIFALLAYASYLFSKAGGFAASKWSPFLSLNVWQFLGAGLVETFRIAIVDAILSVVVGAIVALGQVSSRRTLRWMAIVYSECFRGLPTLLLVLFVYFAFPALGINVTGYWAVVLGSAAYNSAVLSNVFKAGILSLDRGQVEASYSIGLSQWDTMRIIVAPQAFQRMLPTVVAQLVVLFKDSSLGFFIGYEELLRRTQIVGAYSENLIQSYMVAGALYFMLCYLISRLARFLERSNVSKGGTVAVTTD
ncbi:MAG: amino acid ABC transporter permease [Variibacter sp.]